MALNELFSAIEKQMTSKFTGKLNIASKDSGQFLGQINVLNGLLIFCTFKNYKGLRGFYSMAYEFNCGSLKVMPEAEIIDENLKNIHFPFSILKKKSEYIVKTYEGSKNQAPPKSVNLAINPDFVDGEDGLSQDEYETLLEISKYPNIGDLYEKSYFTEQELTNNLVSLRKKNSVKVYR